MRRTGAGTRRACAVDRRFAISAVPPTYQLARLLQLYDSGLSLRGCREPVSDAARCQLMPNPTVYGLLVIAQALAAITPMFAIRRVGRQVNRRESPPQSRRRGLFRRQPHRIKHQGRGQCAKLRVRVCSSRVWKRAREAVFGGPFEDPSDATARPVDA